jgi:hypothetical protein
MTPEPAGKVLDELSSRCLVFDQYGAGSVALRLLFNGTLEVRIVEPSPIHVEKIEAFAVDAPCRGGAIVVQFGRFVRGVPALDNTAEAGRPFV